MSRWQTVTRPVGVPLQEKHLRAMLRALGETPPPPRNTGQRSRLVVRPLAVTL